VDGQAYTKFLGMLGRASSWHRIWTTGERQEAYTATSPTGTNNEFGFDYLRDNMKFQLEQCRTARPPTFSIVDESGLRILIDEARTPLIISRPQRGIDRQVHEGQPDHSQTDTGASVIEGKDRARSI